RVSADAVFRSALNCFVIWRYPIVSFMDLRESSPLRLTIQAFERLVDNALSDSDPRFPMGNIRGFTPDIRMLWRGVVILVDQHVRSGDRARRAGAIKHRHYT